MVWSFAFGSSFEFWAQETLGYDPFSRVGACGRRPSESADPGGSASWAFYRASIACTVEKKLYGGRGLGLVRCPQVSAEVFQIGGFTIGKYRISLWGRFRVRTCLRTGRWEAFGGFPESFCELQGGPKWAKWDQCWTDLSSGEAKRGLKVS